uniref:Uncharacterized protein n=1 Tax=Anguilla anguilla TaxID=7936 RepID=A0A0E9TCM3_ANGAN
MKQDDQTVWGFPIDQWQSSSMTLWSVESGNIIIIVTIFF